MSPVSLLLNLFWILCGGLWMAAGWVIAGIIMAITIVGIPWARAAFNIAAYTLLPFGQKAVPREMVTGEPDIGTGAARHDRQHHLVRARRLVARARSISITAFVLALTIVGLPFAWAHLKLAGIALWPIGKTIVPA